MSRHVGFTLVELLVVIAVIALLISILAPSLTVAKEIAKKATCLANLHVVGAQVILYANQNRGMLVPYDRADAATGYTENNIRYSCTNYYYEKPDPANPGNPLKRKPFNLAIAVESFDLPYRSLYCPDAKFEYAGTYIPPWGCVEASSGFFPTTMQLRSKVSSSYMYNPYFKGLGKGNWWLELRHTQLDSLSSTQALAIDMFDQANVVWHTAGAVGWNVVHPGGNCASYDNRDVYNLIKANPIIGSGSPDTTAYQVLDLYLRKLLGG